MTPDKATPDARDRREAVALLVHSARPDTPVLRGAVVWLVLAAALEALGPLLGKTFIDRHLLPRDGNLVAIAGLLGGALVAGWIANALRYWQLVRLAGVAMRSVQRLREQVYGHVLRLPMAFSRSVSLPPCTPRSRKRRCSWSRSSRPASSRSAISPKSR